MRFPTRKKPIEFQIVDGEQYSQIHQELHERMATRFRRTQMIETNLNFRETVLTLKSSTTPFHNAYVNNAKTKKR